MEVGKYLKHFKDKQVKIIKRGYLEKRGTIFPVWKKKSVALFPDKISFYDVCQAVISRMRHLKIVWDLIHLKILSRKVIFKCSVSISSYEPNILNFVVLNEAPFSLKVFVLFIHSV